MRRCKERGVERGASAVHAIEDATTAVRVEARETVERIAPRFVDARAHKEVTGHTDAVDCNTDAPADFHHEHRERDRNAGTARDHRVEVRVLGIGVVVNVAAERKIVREVFPYPVEARRAAGLAGGV